MGLEAPTLAALSLAAGLASSAGGAIMSSKAQKQAGQDAMMQAQARNKQLGEYRERMAALQEEAQKNNQQTQEAYNPDEAKAREEKANAQLTDQYQQAADR